MQLFRGRKFFMGVAAMLALVVVAVGCTGNGDGAGEGNGAGVVLSSSQLGELAAGVGTLYSGSAQGSGIQVTGVGSVTAQPDLAVLTLGVEAFATTVSEARETAAQAINNILTALRAQGLQDNDMQTTRFDLQPEYTYEEEVVSSASTKTVRRNVQRLIGYRVNNTLTVKIRDMDSVGSIIDATVEAGGDATRINRIQFTVEDGTALEGQARLLAVQDALSKAEVFAEATGVTLGKLRLITEVSSPQFARVEAAMDMRMAAAAPTAILAGEQAVTVRVQAIFAID
jgi:uncharacterized protein YggE